MGEKVEANSEWATSKGLGVLLPARHSAVRKEARVAAAAALLLCLGSQNLHASEPTIATGPMIQRSTRIAPRRYIIQPSGATVATNQTQRFGVVDANGNPVAVRWNVSGLGCYGSSCGSVDEEGVYHPPATLPKPGIVTLEGVVIADPHYSVLTEIRLQAPTSTASPTLAAAPAPRPQLPIPDLPSGSRAETMPLPGAVAAAPTGAGTKVARRAEIVPLPTVVAAVPTVVNRSPSRTPELAPVPVAVAAAPNVAELESGGAEKLVPLPAVIAAAPPITNEKVSSRTASPPLPAAVATAPVIGSGANGKGSRSKEEPLTLVVGPVAIVSSQREPRAKELSTQSSPAGASSPAAAQAVGVGIASRPPQAPVVSSAMTTAPNLVSSQAPGLRAPERPVSTEPAVSAAAQANAGHSQLSEEKPKAAEGVDHTSVRVTYRGGLLTIDASNASLAEVLKLVSEKTGAKIDVPPGTGLERIVEHAGPGTPNDILTQLLNGSQFNFIMINSPQRPEDLAEVLLSVRPAEAELANVPNTPNPPAPEPTSSTATNPYLFHPLPVPAGAVSSEANVPPVKSKLPAHREAEDPQNPPQ